MRGKLLEHRGRKRQAGVGLVDAVIAAAIIAIAVGVAYPGLKIANDTMATSGRKDRIERAGDQMLREVLDSIRGGRILALSESPAVPEVTIGHLKQNIDLEDFEDDEATPWQEGAVTIRFHQEEVLKESDLGVDINGDADRTDEFASGILVIDDGEFERPITQRARVLLALPGYVGDLDGDGQADPLFTRDDKSVTVSIHLLSRGEGGALLTSSVHGGVRLRNIQE